jgi:hypothetical protein
MNIAKQLEDIRAAEEAINQAKGDVIARLDASAEIINAIKRKRFARDKLPSPFEWTLIYKDPKARIVACTRPGFSLTLYHDGKQCDIASVFVTGSMWGAAKAAREVFYYNKDLRARIQHGECERYVRDAEKIVAKDIADIQKDADNKIAAIQRTRGAELKDQQKNLVQLTHQVARYSAWKNQSEAKRGEKASETLTPPGIIITGSPGAGRTYIAAEKAAESERRTGVWTHREQPKN